MAVIDGGTLQLTEGAGTIDFAMVSGGIGGTLDLTGEGSGSTFTGDFTAVISGFAPTGDTAPNDVIDVTGSGDAGDYVVWTRNGASGALQVENASDDVLESMTLDGTYAQDQFVLTRSGSVDQITYTRAAILTTLASFDGADGGFPYAEPLFVDVNGDLFGTTDIGDGTVFEIAKTANGYADTPATLATFNGAVGSAPTSGVIADRNGDLFGTTDIGDGTVFEIAKTANGYASTPETLVTFNGDDGQSMFYGLTADANGDLFGTTILGGPNNDGTVFEIAKTASGYASAPTMLASFDGDDGDEPFGPVFADSAGDLFGVTSFDGATATDAPPPGDGTVFEILKAPTGYASPLTLASFTGTDGAGPAGPLIADANGDLFGTTAGGGTYGDGTVFEIAKTINGYADAPTPLVNFDGMDGRGPQYNLIMDAAGDLFGTTFAGESQDKGTVFEIAKTASGYASAPTQLVVFTGSNGAYPISGLTANSAGDLFGTTMQGGPGGGGTVFELTRTGFQVPAIAGAHAS